MKKQIKSYAVYQIINRNKKLVYYGVSKDVFNRFASHKRSRSTKQSALYDSFCVYGVESFDFEVLFVFNRVKEMIQKEKELIESAPNDYVLLNRSAGGEYCSRGCKDVFSLRNISDVALFVSEIEKVENYLKHKKETEIMCRALLPVAQW